MGEWVKVKVVCAMDFFFFGRRGHGSGEWVSASKQQNQNKQRESEEVGKMTGREGEDVEGNLKGNSREGHIGTVSILRTLTRWEGRLSAGRRRRGRLYWYFRVYDTVLGNLSSQVSYGVVVTTKTRRESYGAQGCLL